MHRSLRQAVTRAQSADGVDGDADGRVERLLAIPFGFATIAGWALAVVGNPVQRSLYAVSIAVLLLSLALARARNVRIGAHPLGDLAAGIVAFVAIGLLRASSVSSSEVGTLALIPVFWVALAGREPYELPVMLVAMIALYVVPVVVVGSPDYHPDDLRRALLTVVVSGIMAIVVQRLVAHIRSQAQRAQRDRHSLEQVSEVIYTLFASGDVRSDLCSASLAVADASAAVLFEPDPAGRRLRVTGEAGMKRSVLGAAVGLDTPIGQALAEGEQRLLNAVDPSRLASVDLWDAGGRPDAVLYRPLLRGNEPVGLLVVGWHDVVRISGPRVTAIGLLTHEAALLLTRADQIARLAGMATTDPLTGLANRRAWDARLAQAAGDPGRVTVAMLDLDNFKQFNDARGHIAGDALLRETAAAWTAQLRPGDLVARVGGEEFGLLLFGCDRETAVDVIERLRAAVTDGQTCSAGVAQRRTGETMESVVTRADRALYAAKADGRDLARAAV